MKYLSHNFTGCQFFRGIDFAQLCHNIKIHSTDKAEGSRIGSIIILSLGQRKIVKIVYFRYLLFRREKEIRKHKSDYILQKEKMGRIHINNLSVCLTKARAGMKG